MKAELGLKGLSIADIFRAPTLGGLHGILAAKAGAPAKPRQKVQKPEASSTPAPAVAAPPPVEENSLVSRRRAMRTGRSAGA